MTRVSTSEEGRTAGLGASSDMSRLSFAWPEDREQKAARQRGGRACSLHDAQLAPVHIAMTFHPSTLTQASVSSHY